MIVKNTILVTGATGNVGRQVVSQLIAEHTCRVRALTRNPAAAGLPGDVDVCQGDLADPATLETALEGADAVFLMWPFHNTGPASAVVEAIKRHAHRVVFLSSGAVQAGFAPDQQPHPVGRSHAHVEQLIEQSGLTWSYLRPSTFAANTLWWADQIRAGDMVRAAYGAAPMALLHEADIAAVAVRALTEGGHERAVHDLTGPEVLTQAEQVRTIGEVLGRPIRWQELPREEARRLLLADDDFPDSFVDPLLDGYAGMLNAPRPTITSTVETVTGTPARTYREWVSDHAADFR
ncbi:nucleotide-diphosphate-sugar epimerase [Streptomyces spinoverrucosus]|uniref:Nucleotide-diphosphate-sugar epimerase n=1 Tax=Streptomyces spinoverrucosus TaxID=284043 RepID=A0A4Y3VW68_9ACTN|nr:NAD(P)H-binding protein [Streptomyces spinoverrucosus]GEC10011.1 nucleotide-diphosphate-sugar epimerase [Streptomyces spinoverrucosus]GHB75164.1 nucleotide-diphosphate-sugar epimerase [Streptomyces spinoverrucosus]